MTEFSSNHGQKPWKGRLLSAGRPAVHAAVCDDFCRADRGTARVVSSIEFSTVRESSTLEDRPTFPTPGRTIKLEGALITCSRSHAPAAATFAARDFTKLALRLVAKLGTEAAVQTVAEGSTLASIRGRGSVSFSRRVRTPREKACEHEEHYRPAYHDPHRLVCTLEQTGRRTLRPSKDLFDRV
jgi:hypothetical protein